MSVIFPWSCLLTGMIKSCVRDIMNIFAPVGGGKVSPRKSVVQSSCQYDVTSSVGDFSENGEQSVHRRDG